MTPRLRGIFFYLVSIAIPLSIIILWYLTDHAYPRRDEGQFLEVSQDIFLKLKEHGLSALSALYWERVFKPILHVSTAVPFFFLSQGRVQLAQALACLFYFIVFQNFVFFYFYKRTSAFQACAASLFICSIPWILQSVTSYNSELPFLAVSAGALYFASALENFDSTKQSLFASIFFALAICIRPIEGSIEVFFAVAFFSFDAFVKKRITKQDLLVLIFLILSSLIVFSWQIYSCLDQPCGLDHRLLSLACLLLVVPAIALAPKLGLNNSYLTFLVTIFSLVSLWFAPFMIDLFHWVYETSYGQLAIFTGARTGISMGQFLLRVFWGDFGWIFIVLGATALLQFRSLDHKKFLLILLMAGTPLALGALTYNGDLRYYYLGAFLLFVSLINASFYSPKNLKKWNGYILFAMGIYQSVAAALWVHDRPRLPNLVSIQYQEPLRVQDPIVRGLEDLRTVLPKEKTDICLLQMPQGNALDWTYDPWALTLRARELALPWHFSWPFPYEFSNTEDRYRQAIVPRCDFVAVLPLEWKAAPLGHFMSDVGEKMFLLWKQNKLNQSGWMFISKMNYVASDGHQGELLVLKNLRRAPYLPGIP